MDKIIVVGNRSISNNRYLSDLEKDMIRLFDVKNNGSSILPFVGAGISTRPIPNAAREFSLHGISYLPKRYHVIYSQKTIRC